MMPIGGNIWLEGGLRPFVPFLARAEVSDIWVNRPGEVWLETLGGGIERHEVPELTDAKLLRLVRQISAMNALGINREYPILSATLPGGERVQAIMPPATRGHIVIAVRKQAMARVELEDYILDHGAPDRVLLRQPLAEVPSDPAQYPAYLREAVRNRRNILISGGTSSGKTTFLNALLREVPQKERLIFIEDTPELIMAQPNCVGLIAARGALGEADVSAEDLLVAALRMRPDRIILGEIRGTEAATFLRAVNTGHPGSISTIHADSPERAIDQMALLVMQAGTNASWADVTGYVRRMVDVIVQLERGGAGRIISAIACAAHAGM